MDTILIDHSSFKFYLLLVLVNALYFFPMLVEGKMASLKSEYKLDHSLTTFHKNDFSYQSRPFSYQETNSYSTDLDKNKLKTILKAAFQGLLEVDDRNYITPQYIISDFNGDKLGDLAILTRPSKGLRSSDTRKPTFWLNQVTWKPQKNHNKRQATPKLYFQSTIGELAAYQDDPLPVIAIIHGVLNDTWENIPDQRKFVILNGVNGGSSKMSLFKGKIKEQAIGDSGIVPPPQLSGNALLFSDGTSGNIIYWSGGAYFLYPIESSRSSISQPLCRFSHLAEWVNELPVSNKNGIPKNILKIYELDWRLLWLLGEKDYREALQIFENGSPVQLNNGYLVAIGENLKKKGLLAIRLNDPEGLCTLCIGFSYKEKPNMNTDQVAWHCMRGDYMRSSHQFLPTKIQQMLGE